MKKSEQGSYIDFMCDCREEGKGRCLQCLQDVCNDLSCKPEEIVTCVVAGLTFGLPNDYTGGIKGIGMDMWFGINAEMLKGDEEAITFFIQCDKLEHGFARLWQMAKEAAGPEEEKSNGTGD